MPFVKRAEAAERIGVSRQRLEKLIKQGRIIETDQGVDLDSAIAYRSVTIDTVKELAGTARPPATAAAARSVAKVKTDDDGKPVVDFAAAKTKREINNAALAELRYLEMAGKLISADEVKAKEFEVARKLRDRLLGIPARIQNFITPQAMQVVTEEIEAAIKELQEDAARIAERSD